MEKVQLFGINASGKRVPIKVNDYGQITISRSIEGGIMGNFIGASVFNSADILIPASSTVILTFDSEQFDTNNFHNTLSNTSRITIANTGYYRVTYHLDLDDWSNANTVAEILLNGTASIHKANSGGSLTTASIVNGSKILYFTPTLSSS